ncbi:MAG: glycosyltransferase family 2 protein [Candidatus Levybacteria bacterium]|nr:glycosyltransferase family 2 protein [Candidatus Levybacteria bacterium]
MQKISAVVSAYNEEIKIEKCLKSLLWADEVIVVDNSSTDKTSEISKKLGALVLTQPNNPLLIDLQKNTGFKKAKNEWILCIDADEAASPELKKEIQSLLKGKNFKDGYFIPRKNIIFGKQIEYCGWYPDHQLRLFRKGKGEFRSDHVHEGIQIDGQVEYLKEHIVHYNYETVIQFIHKNMIIYAQNEANNLINKNFVLKPRDLIKIPSEEFLSRFFARKGYKDGIHGLFLSLLMAASQLIVLALIWEKSGFKKAETKNLIEDVGEEFKNLNKKVEHWTTQIKIEDSKNPINKFYQKIRRKL